MAKTSSDQRRLIDTMSMPENPRKLKVFVVGLCRTGTTTIRVALRQYGYKAHGMAEAMDDAQGKYWSEAVKLKYHPDDPATAGLKPYGAAEFKKLFANYDAITDLPGVLFIDEIRQTFPDARIVVSNRDTESWQKSMDQTILAMMRWKTFLPLAKIQGGDAKDSICCIYDSVSQVGGGGDAYMSDERMLEGYKKHYEVLRQTIPADQRLEYSVRDGWEPLCKFLDLDVPDEPFPHINDSRAFMQWFGGIWWNLFAMATAKAILTVAAATYGGFTAAKYLQMRSK